MSDTKLIQSIDIDDKGSAKLERFTRKMGDAGKQTSLTGKAFGDLKTKAENLGVPIGGLEKYLGGFGGVALGAVAGVAALGVGLGALAMHATTVLDQLGDLATQTGTSTEYLSKMRNVVGISNLSMDQFGNGLSVITKNIISNGDQLRKLGIDTTNAGTAWDSLKVKIAATEDPIEKQRIGQEALGKQYKDFANILSMNQSEYEKLIGSTTVFTEEQAKAAGEFDDNIAILKTSFSDFGVSIGSILLPSLVKATNGVRDLLDAFRELSKEDGYKLQSTGLNVVSSTGRGTQKLSETNFGSKDAQAKLKAMSSQEVLQLQVYAQTNNELGLAKKLNALREEKYKSEAEAKEKQDKENLAKQKLLEATEKQTKAKEKLAELSKKEAEAYAKFLKDNNLNGPNQSVQVDYLNDTPEGQKLLEERNSRLERTSDDAATLNQGQSQNISYLSDSELENTKHNWNKSRGETDEQRNIRLAEANKLLAEQKTLVDSIGAGFANLTTGPLTDFYKHIGSSNKDLGSNFSALFSNIQDSFGDMMASMLAQLTAKAAIFGMLKLLAGGGGLGSGFAFAQEGLKSFSWFANGSDYVPRSGIYTVGERGPEQVVLPKGAQVKSNDSISSNSTSMQITINQAPGMSSEEITREIERYNRRKGGR